MIKVKDGTRSGVNLCKTCRNVLHIKGARESHEVIRCGSMRNNVVPFDVVECSDYDDKNLVSLMHLERTAWILETDKNRRQIGFVPVKIWEETHAREAITPERD